MRRGFVDGHLRPRAWRNLFPLRRRSLRHVASEGSALSFGVMTELLDDIRAQIETRIGELRPFVDEAQRLEQALDALNATGLVAESDGRRAGRSRSGRTRTGRSRQEVPVAAAVVDYVRAHPGATAGEVATALGRRRSSIATRLTQLSKKGQLSKAERGYTAA